MKNSVLFFIFFLIFFSNVLFLDAQEVTGKVVTGEVVTGEATQQEFNLGIYVSILTLPSLSISAPLNGTYLKTNDIPLIYSVSNYNDVWYNLDNGENKSITPFFNTTRGTHTLYLYANNSQGTASKNVTFSVNPERFVVKYNKWTSQGNSSLSFNDSTYEQMNDLEGIFFESTNNGKISFDGGIDLVQDSNPLDNFTNLNENINISRNYIGLSSENLPNFNKPASLHLYHLSFSNPRVLKDGIVCPDEICTGISYNSGTLSFDVTHFTTYSAEETPISEHPSEEGGDGGSGGGGGTIGGRNVTLPNATGQSSFYSQPDIISIDVEKGKSYMQQVTLYNSGTKDITISVSSSPEVSRFIQLDEKSFVLKKGESKVYRFHVYSSTRTEADLYTGRLIFDSGRGVVSVDMAISVQELPALFDMKLTSTKEYVAPGRIASAEIKIANIGDSESINAVLEYGVMDFNNIIYVSKTENITVKRDILSKKVSLKLPENIEMGKYLFYSKVIYEDKIAVSNDTFQIENISATIWVIALILVMILMLLTLFAIVVVKKRNREKEIEQLAKNKASS